MSTVETTKELEYQLRRKKFGKHAVAVTVAVLDWLDLGIALKEGTELCEMVADKLEELMPANSTAAFGQLVWDALKERYPEDAVEFDEGLMELASQAGLVARVVYDPAIHDDVPDAEPGDSIWWWGEDKPTAAPPSLQNDRGEAIRGK